MNKISPWILTAFFATNCSLIFGGIFSVVKVYVHVCHIAYQDNSCDVNIYESAPVSSTLNMKSTLAIKVLHGQVIPKFTISWTISSSLDYYFNIIFLPEITRVIQPSLYCHCFPCALYQGGRAAHNLDWEQVSVVNVTSFTVYNIQLKHFFYEPQCWRKMRSLANRRDHMRDISWLIAYYTGGILQWLDTDLHCAVTVMVRTVML